MNRIFFALLFLFIVAVTVFTGVVGLMALNVAVLKYEWMVEHSMLKHSYAFAAIAVVLEISGLMLLRRGVMFAYEAFYLAFLAKEKSDESV